jgi:hypothetical protein
MTVLLESLIHKKHNVRQSYYAENGWNPPIYTCVGIRMGSKFGYAGLVGAAFLGVGAVSNTI